MESDWDHSDATWCLRRVRSPCVEILVSDYSSPFGLPSYEGPTKLTLASASLYSNSSVTRSMIGWTPLSRRAAEKICPSPEGQERFVGFAMIRSRQRLIHRHRILFLERFETAGTAFVHLYQESNQVEKLIGVSQLVDQILGH
jgi:hypothetical protein